ncbi:hypothetical protein [Tahibacter harae]|uniref:Uncharacterized protein n=1 Tax=Tahibacter harae TaxID=2963937 RepID=A0ABT1QZF5_9GAMM|nr:hypothetical protein [Tahibacter harae]MCQ4167670.1 hypothetical protein [Tahibacter harae]
MPRPTLTPEETALLVRLRQPHSLPMFELGYLVPSGLLIGFGFLRGEPAAFAAAFAVIATFSLWSLRAQSAGLALLRTILQKYETALDQAPPPRADG